MKAITLLSGGKDSFLASLFALEQGMDLVLSVGVQPEEYSEMFHFQNYKWSKNVADLLNLKHIFVREENFYSDIKKLVEETGSQALVSGAIMSNFQKTRLEKLATDMNIISYTPLWNVDQERELLEVILSRIEAQIISVSADGLDKRYLGMVIDTNLLSNLLYLNKKNGINIAGEGGEYETFVSGYLSKKNQIKKFSDQDHGSMHIRVIEEI